jgi:hypothetical protein
MASVAVMTAVKARVDAGFMSIPVYWPNATTKPPAGLVAYVVAEFPIGFGNQISVGNPGANRFRETGTIRFVVHVALGSGWEAAAGYADALAALFRSTQFAGVTTWTPSPPVAKGEEGGRYVMSFSVPYYFDEIG